MIRNFYDLDAWKQGHNFVLEIYRITKRFPKEELYGLISQLRRASSSIAANIAEGFSRYHFKDKTKFYYQARGSLAEVQNYLFLAKDLKFIDEKQWRDLLERADQIKQLINGLNRSIQKQRIS